MAGGRSGGASTSTASATTAIGSTRISSSVLGFNWCMKKPVALGSSTPPGARRANGKKGATMSSRDNDDVTVVDGATSAGTAGGNNNSSNTMAKKGSPNPARDLAESLSAYGDVPFSPRKGCENTGESRRHSARAHIEHRVVIYFNDCAPRA